jgi:hypothetical protein
VGGARARPAHLPLPPDRHRRAHVGPSRRQPLGVADDGDVPPLVPPVGVLHRRGHDAPGELGLAGPLEGRVNRPLQRRLVETATVPAVLGGLATMPS